MNVVVGGEMVRSFLAAGGDRMLAEGREGREFGAAEET
jgi:hypothetical protein